jgi:hypothetical protein
MTVTRGTEREYLAAGASTIEWGKEGRNMRTIRRAPADSVDRWQAPSTAMTALAAGFDRSVPMVGREPVRAVALGYRRGFLVRHLPQQWATRQLLVALANRHGCALADIVDQPPDERPGAGFERLLWLAARIDGLHAIVTPSWRHLADSEPEARGAVQWLQVRSRVPLYCGDQQ